MDATQLRIKILNANDLTTEAVHVPEWGVTVYVRSMTGRERDEWEASLVAEDEQTPAERFDNLRARLVARTVIDEDGKHVFTTADVAALGGKAARALQRIYNVAQRLSAVTNADVEELTKNSSDGQTGGSSSD